MTLPAAPQSLPLEIAAALLGERDPARLAAFVGEPRSEVELRCAALALPSEDADRLVSHWLTRAGAPAAVHVDRAVATLAGAGELAAAARLAVRHGRRSTQRLLLSAHGWALLLSATRAVMDTLFESVLADAEPLDDALHGLHLLWLVEARRLPHEAARRLRARPLADAGVQALVESRCAQMFDAPVEALRYADGAVGLLPEGEHPAASLALFARGFARLEAGWPEAALDDLGLALRGATRDGHRLLQIDALHVLARAHDERGDDAACGASLARALSLAAQAGVQQLPALDSLRRLAAWRALRDRLLGGTQATGALTEAVPWGHAFPARVLQGAQALLDGRWADLRDLVEALQQEQEQSFLPLKWRAEFGWLRLARAARAGLPWRGTGGQPADPATLAGLQLRLLDAAGLGAMSEAALADDLSRRGLRRLAARLKFIGALADGDEAGLLAWWLDPAHDPLDALWLAPRALPALERLRHAPGLGSDAEAPLRLAALLKALAGPALDVVGAAALPSNVSELTAREWEVLRLIAADFTNEQIATRLGVSVVTIKTHINRGYAKLAVATRAQAAQRVRTLLACAGMAATIPA
ncbi:LuxR C-terminal-related transcriptional regulator [Burkholderiaceae bacterium UC74_6]